MSITPKILACKAAAPKSFAVAASKKEFQHDLEQISRTSSGHL